MFRHAAWGKASLICMDRVKKHSFNGWFLPETNFRQNSVPLRRIILYRWRLIKMDVWLSRSHLARCRRVGVTPPSRPRYTNTFQRLGIIWSREPWPAWQHGAIRLYSSLALELTHGCCIQLGLVSQLFIMNQDLALEIILAWATSVDLDSYYNRLTNKSITR